MTRVDDSLFPSDKPIYVDVITRYYVIRLTARSYTRCRSLQNLAHWCMDIDISSRADPCR